MTESQANRIKERARELGQRLPPRAGTNTATLVAVEVRPLHEGALPRMADKVVPELRRAVEAMGAPPIGGR